MALTWNIIVNVLDVERGEASITGKCVDDADPSNPRSYTIQSALIKDDKQKEQVIQGLKDLYEADIKREKQIAELIDGFNDNAKATLEDKGAS